MLDKENIGPPKKQGILYAISTGKNNGVYLPKDISHSNHKSLNLLTKEAQESHKSYVDTLKLIQRQKQKQQNFCTNLIQVQSFNQNYDFSTKCIKSLKNVVNECGTLRKNLKDEFERLNNNVLHQNNQLNQVALPALRSLKQKIKTNKQQQMANYSKMHRQLQKIQQCFNLISSGIKQCDRKFQFCQDNYKGKQQEF